MSERFQYPQPELARRTREAQPGVESAHVVLIGKVRAVQRGHPVAVLPGKLRVHDIARLDAIATGLVLEQGSPLFANVAVVDARREFVFAALAEDVLHADVER